MPADLGSLAEFQQSLSINAEKLAGFFCDEGLVRRASLDC
jgi:hypothetical protein